MIARLIWLYRQLNNYPQAAKRAIFQRHLAAMTQNYIAGNRKAQPGAAC